MVSNMVCRIIPMHQCLLVIAVPAFLCSSSHLFLIPKSFARTFILYYYCFSLPIFFCNSFVTPLAFVPLILLFQVPPVSSWLTASSLVLPFSAISYSGTSLKEWHGSGLARRKRSEYLPESLRADSPAWLTSLLATPKMASLNDGCRLWGLGGTEGKAFRHTTFCISRIVASTTGEIQRVVCWWAISTRVRRKCQTDGKHLSVPSNAHLLYGLAVPAFLCSSLGVFLFSMPFFYTLFGIQNSRFLRHCQEDGQATWLQSDPWTFAGISVRPLDTFPWQR